MVNKHIFDSYDFAQQEVPKYEWQNVQVGWTTEKQRVPQMAPKQVREWGSITLADTFRKTLRLSYS
jgi:hypothetical protein